MFVWRLLAVAAATAAGAVDPSKQVTLLARPSRKLPEKFRALFAREERIRESANYRASVRHIKLRRGRVRESSVGSTAAELFAALAAKRPLRTWRSPGAPEWSASQTAPHEGPMKVVIGIPFMETQADVQKAHRETWMRQPGVCAAARHSEEACQYFPVMLFGNASADERERLRSASLGCDVAFIEGAHTGKTNGSGYAGEAPFGPTGTTDYDFDISAKEVGWVRHVRDHFPWATHLMKIDSDAYPVLPLVTEDLLHSPRHGLFYGKYMGVDFDCVKGIMCGGLYVISADLIDCFVAQRDLMSFPRQQTGDSVFSEVLFAAQRDGRCPPLTCVQPPLAQGVGFSPSIITRFLHPV